MDFDFSPEQQQLKDQARRCLADHCSSTAVRAVLDGPQSFDAALWRGLGEQGYLGAALPEQLGRVTPASIGCAVSQGRPRGSKCPVADGDIANFANVATRDGGAATLSLQLVGPAGAGVQRTLLPSIDPTRSQAADSL